VQTPTEIVASLAQQLDAVRHPRAKACVFWLVGQYAVTNQEEIENVSGLPHGQIPGMAIWAPDVLRRAVKSFTQDVSIEAARRLKC
jgi:AP-3 complex subunit beta